MGIRKTEDGKYVLVVNGENVELTEDQLEERINKIQKAEAAEKKFEEAANLRKQAEEMQEQAKGAVAEYRKQLNDLFVRADSQHDEAAYRKFLEMQGYRAQEIEPKVQQYNYAWQLASEADEDEDDTGTGANAPKSGEQGARRQHSQPPSPPRKLSWADLDDEIKQELMEWRKERYSKMRDGAYKELEETLVKEPLLGKVLGEGGSKAEKLKALARSELKGRLRDGDEYGPKLLKDVTSEVRSLAEEFGVGQRPTSVPGLGPTPGVAPTEFQVDKEPEPVSPLDDKYEENFAQRAAYRMAGSN